MADYKRMVSYMYQYDSGVKKKNVGFARVEAKNGQCKITLHMQLLGQLDSIFPTYLIQRGNNNIELIYLGDTMLKNQVMDSKLTADVTNVMGSGYALTDMGGLLLFLNENVFYATEWDDQPIVAKEVLEALKPKSKEETGTKWTENVNAEIKTDEVPVQEEQTIASIEVSPLAAVEIDPLDEMTVPKYKLPRGWKTVERLQNPHRNDDNNHAGEVFEASVINTFSEKESIEGYDLKVEQTDIGIEENISTENISTESISTESISTENISTENISTENISTENMPDCNIDKDITNPPVAENFFEKYPRIYPFEDNEILLCVKIEPKDIGLLPKELWSMSNNSFLLHGYYCYHHLIFAKKKEHSGCCYILGVPGIFHNREQFMARMFGMESFKSIRKREVRQGDFGYWYLPVNL